MNEIPNFKELKLWVARDKIQKVLEQLVNSMPTLKKDASHNEILSLATRWKQLGKNQQKGILSTEQIQLEQNKITNSLLELLDQLDGKSKLIPPAISSSTSLKKYRPYFLLLLLIPIGIWGIQQLLPTEEAPDRNEPTEEGLNLVLEEKVAATSGIFTDPRDQQTYPWAIMKDDKKWMTKNLAYRGVNAYCYADKSDNCTTYGVLYTWSKAKKACPDNWHLPSIEEWDGLFAANGGSYDEANQVAVGDLTSSYRALTKVGTTDFSFLFNGYCRSKGDCDFIGAAGFYWSSKQNGQDDGFYYYFDKRRQEIISRVYTKNSGMACRCVADEVEENVAN